MLERKVSAGFSGTEKTGNACNESGGDVGNTDCKQVPFAEDDFEANIAFHLQESQDSLLTVNRIVLQFI